MYFIYCYVQQYLRMVYERRGVYTLHLYFTKELYKRQGAAGEYPETPCVVIWGIECVVGI